MSTHYRRHRRVFRLASALYLMPCSYNERTALFEETVWNKLAFAVGVVLAVPFWILDTHLMSVEYLNHTSPIMVILGTIEIMVYVSLQTCTLLNVFLRRRRIIRMMNVLYRNDWLLDRQSEGGKRYDNNRKFAITMVTLFAMLCCNMSYHQDISTRMLSLTVAMKMFGVCYLLFLHRICVGAIGVRMEQLKALLETTQGRRMGREQTMCYFFQRYELYAAQVRQVNQCFSLPLTLIMLLVVIEMVYLMFDCFTILQLQRPVLESFESGYTQWALRQMWQSIYAAVVLLIVSGCQQTNDKLDETSLYTRHFDDFRHRNTRSAKQLHRFLLHNLERDTRFSVSGFFNIDYSMIHMLFSSILTHTVILIQFDQLQTEKNSYAAKLNGTV